ncbi:MAG: phosphoribosylformylglycinamidine synthase subunit PurS [Thermovirgaceae bacterium]|nr:phosphoribosylformylglycinamidine synthase subunit PurS [Thermovirgaceae bacterium]
MTFLVKILIFPKEGVLDTQGKAVARSLKRIGFEALNDVRVGKYIQVWLEAGNEAEAIAKAGSMCGELLVNNLIEDHRIEVERCGL